jgi:hypothetical protein
MLSRRPVGQLAHPRPISDKTIIAGAGYPVDAASGAVEPGAAGPPGHWLPGHWLPGHWLAAGVWLSRALENLTTRIRTWSPGLMVPEELPTFAVHEFGR